MKALWSLPVDKMTVSLIDRLNTGFPTHFRGFSRSTWPHVECSNLDRRNLAGIQLPFTTLSCNIEEILVSLVNMARIKLAVKLALEELIERTCVRYTGVKSSENEACEQLASPSFIGSSISKMSLPLASLQIELLLVSSNSCDLHCSFWYGCLQCLSPS